MREMKDSKVKWLGVIPLEWKVERVKHGFIRKKAEAHQDNPIVLSLARTGVRERDISNNEGQIAESYYNYNPVDVDDLLINPMDLYSGANCSISKISGVISPAYVNLRYREGYNPQYYDYYFKLQYWLMAFFAHGKGVSYENRWTLNAETLMNYNPIKQNRTHIKALAEYLGKPASEFMSYIVFSERCTLKKVPPDTSDVIIVRRPHMLNRLRSQLNGMSVKYTHDEIVAMKDKLTNLTNKSTAEKKQHIENIKTKCPFCGSELVKRNGKYGMFWGCSAYPKCKFTRPIDK